MGFNSCRAGSVAAVYDCRIGRPPGAHRDAATATAQQRARGEHSRLGCERHWRRNLIDQQTTPCACKAPIRGHTRFYSAVAPLRARAALACSSCWTANFSILLLPTVGVGGSFRIAVEGGDGICNRCRCQSLHMAIHKQHIAIRPMTIGGVVIASP